MLGPLVSRILQNLSAENRGLESFLTPFSSLDKLIKVMKMTRVKLILITTCLLCFSLPWYFLKEKWWNPQLFFSLWLFFDMDTWSINKIKFCLIFWEFSNFGIYIFFSSSLPNSNSGRRIYKRLMKI